MWFQWGIIPQKCQLDQFKNGRLATIIDYNICNILGQLCQRIDNYCNTEWECSIKDAPWKISITRGERGIMVTDLLFVLANLWKKFAKNLELRRPESVFLTFCGKLSLFNFTETVCYHDNQWHCKIYSLSTQICFGISLRQATILNFFCLHWQVLILYQSSHFQMLLLSKKT